MFIHAYKEIKGPYWVAAFSTDNVDIDSIFKWCYKSYGPGLGDFRVHEPCDSPFTHRWVNDIKWGEVRFSKQDDLNWFMLRWT